MYRLLVVDDEPFIVNGLYEFLLHAPGLELDVYRAYSGDEAVEWLQRTKIDIVITDIRMPGMTGLQLLETIKRRWPHCRTIFLTGYDEFDYVYKAIQNETAGYLLKTEGYEKILELVEKAVRDIEAALTAEDLLSRAQRQMKLAAPALQKELLLGLLWGERIGAEARHEQFRQLGIPLNPHMPFALALGRVGRQAAGAVEVEPLRAESLFRLKLAAEQYIPEELCAYYLAADNQTLVWLLQPKQQDGSGAERIWTGIAPQIQGWLELVQDACRGTMQLAVSFVVASEPIGWDQASDRYDSLQAWLGGMPDIGGRGVIMQYTSDRNSLPFLQTNEAYISVFKQLMLIERLGRLLESGRKEECLELLREMTGAAERMTDGQPQAASGLYQALSLLLLSAIQAQGMFDRLDGDIDLRPLTYPDLFASLPDKAGYYHKLAEMMFDRKSGIQESRALSAVQFIQQYIGAHLHEDLSLVRLAEVSHFNPSYLSRLFKQVTGDNLNAYIQETRLNHAIELLKDPSLKIHEIALRVGYEYAPYFTKIFKKATGMNPQEYRELYGNK